LARIDVRPVRGLADRRRFVDLPFKLHGHNPAWVPPLRLSVYDRLSPRHPASATQRHQLWTAFRDGMPAGRVGACIDTAHERLHGERWCWVGFFESIDDDAVASSLFDAALAWARTEGARTCVGPASFTLNDECGLLVENFDDPPLFLTPYNPPYYERLWTSAGWQPEMDLWGWKFERRTTELSDRPKRVLERLRTRSKLTIRGAVMRDFDAEVARLFDVYNAAWVRNWGFAPMSQAEVTHLAKQVKRLVDPNLVLLAEAPDGETVGVAIVLPDVNEVLARVRSGRLVPTGWFHLWRGLKRPTRARVFALGIKPEYQARAVGPLLYNEIVERLRAIPSVQMTEASWVLATNDAMNTAIAAIGATRYRTWRMYRCDP
jgi:GNAT superfamily N-acetyltransferase